MKKVSISTLAKTGGVAAFAAMMAFAVANISAREGQGHSMSGMNEKAGDVVKGASLWANTCQRCHNMRDPGELDDKQWKTAVTHMRIRAGLTGQDARDVLAFLQQSNGK